MLTTTFYYGICAAWLAFAAISATALRFVTAPYGRFTRQGWGPSLDRRVGWIAMELPAVLGMAALFAVSARRADLVPMVWLGLWQLHYLYRTFVFPLRMRGNRHGMTVITVTLAVVFNLGNGYLNGAWLFFLGPVRDASWLTDPRFLFGTALFLGGFGIHVHADDHLRSLRAAGETGYTVPRAFLFRYVSCANYLGELVEWAGWALLTWSPGGLVFFLWTAANLVPRALSHHRFYKQTFADYPQDRKAVIPFCM